MMKTTQFLTNIKLWQGIFFSFLLLVSLNLNSQNVGDDLLAALNLETPYLFKAYLEKAKSIGINKYIFFNVLIRYL